MARPQQPQSVRKSSAPWDRLRPAKQDPLEAMGFVSKGDSRLLDTKAQEAFYQKIVARYMQFCSQHSRDLDNAFASLSLTSESSATSDPARNPPIGREASLPTVNATRPSPQGVSASRWASSPSVTASRTDPADELSAILMALRKLREGLLATSSSVSSPVFSQRVHVFNIRLAILALHPPSYHPSLVYLLRILHTTKHPLPDPELREMTTYLILDLALRENDLIAAYALRHQSEKRFNYENRQLDSILRAVVTGNWVSFWRIRRQVDGYIRAMMHWHMDTIRKTTLKVFGRAYMKVDEKWLLKSTSGNEMKWEDLVAKEDIGWLRDGGSIMIRKPKAKT